MQTEVLTDTATLLIRRLRLEPGEAMYWHVDVCRRFTVVVSGSRLGIEFEDTSQVMEADVHPGLADWDEPENRLHRAVNLGADVYEEVVTFYRTAPGQEPQPRSVSQADVAVDTGIRTYREEDRQQVVALWETTFPDDPHWNQPDKVINTKLTQQPELFLVYQHGAIIVGTVIAGFDGVRGWIHKLSVHPEFQGKGLAQQLMAAAEEQLHKLGCPKVNLQVRDTNSGVINFYQALGYAVESRTSMGKRLGDKA